MKKRNIRLKGAVLACLAAIILIACHLSIVSVDINQPQPDGSMAPRIQAGETAVFRIHCDSESNDNRADEQVFVFSVLAPKNWKVRENAEITYTMTELSDGVTQHPMVPFGVNESPVQMSGYTWAEALLDRYGIGNNILNDMEWVTFKGAESFPLANGNKPVIDVTVKVPVPNVNQRASLGFFINTVQDGMTGDSQYFDAFFTEPFTIYGGQGNLTDFCSYHFYSVEPTKALQNDIVTFSFVGNAYDNDLAGGDVYLRMTANLTNGTTYETKLLMSYPEEDSETYNVTVWPAGAFEELQPGDIISSIDYAFTNADGSIVIDLTKDLEMSGEAVNPDEREPFNLELSCD